MLLLCRVTYFFWDFFCIVGMIDLLHGKLQFLVSAALHLVLVICFGRLLFSLSLSGCCRKWDVGQVGLGIFFGLKMFGGNFEVYVWAYVGFHMGCIICFTLSFFFVVHIR